MEARKLRHLGYVNVILILAGVVSVNSYAGVLVQRSDLSAKLNPVLCGDDSRLSAKSLWNIGVFEAQVQSQKLQSKDQQNIVEKELNSVAQSFATKNQHNAFAYGTCSNGVHWIASMPSPVPLTVINNELRVSAEKVLEYCNSAKIEFASTKIEKSKVLLQLSKKPLVKLNTKFLGDGAIGLSCIPKNDSNLGSVLWTMFPILKGPNPEVPNSDLLDTEDSKGDLNAWLFWLNAMRAQLKLPKLNVRQDEDIIDKLAELLKSQSIYHDRKLNSKTRGLLKTHGIEMLGETRVISSNIKEAAWLLWNSPAHRNMMLHSKANTVSILKSQFSNANLTVMVLSKVTRGTVK